MPRRGSQGAPITAQNAYPTSGVSPPIDTVNIDEAP